MNATTYLRGKIYDHVLRNTAYTPPTALFVALHTGDPGAAGTANELTDEGYARATVTYADDGGDGDGVTNSFVEVGPATEDWTEVTYMSIWDAETSGNALLYKTLDSPRTVVNGSSLTFAIGAISTSIL